MSDIARDDLRTLKRVCWHHYDRPVTEEEFDRLAREWLHKRAEVCESYVEGYLGGSGLMLDYMPDEPGKRFYVLPADWLDDDAG